jgi:hypothetical protein
MCDKLELSYDDNKHCVCVCVATNDKVVPVLLRLYRIRAFCCFEPPHPIGNEKE